MAKMKLKTAIAAVAVLFAVPYFTYAQQLIFEEHPALHPTHPAFGPNHKHFVHVYVSAAGIMPFRNQTSNEIILPFSGIISCGARYKFKLFKPVALVAESGFNYQIYRLNQDPGKSFPDSLINRAQSIHTKGLSGGLFLRIRTGQPGDYLGNFIDLGVTANTALINTLVSKSGLIMGTGGINAIKSIRSAFGDMNPVAWYATVRLGFDRFSLIASCRLSDLINRKEVKDLPRFTIGLEAAIVSY